MHRMWLSYLWFIYHKPILGNILCSHILLFLIWSLILSLCLCFDTCLSGALRWKEDLARKAMEAFQRRQRAAPNLRKLVYGTGEWVNHKHIYNSRQAGICYKRHVWQMICFFYERSTVRWLLWNILRSIVFFCDWWRQEYIECNPVCISHLFVSVVEEEEENSEEEELGGLFRVSRPEKSKKLRADAVDCSRFQPDASHDWDQEEVSNVASTLSYLNLNF